MIVSPHHDGRAALAIDSMKMLWRETLGSVRRRLKAAVRPERQYRDDIDDVEDERFSLIAMTDNRVLFRAR